MEELTVEKLRISLPFCIALAIGVSACAAFNQQVNADHAQFAVCTLPI